MIEVDLNMNQFEVVLLTLPSGFPRPGDEQPQCSLTATLGAMHGSCEYFELN
jgi:hypothetical protein